MKEIKENQKRIQEEMKNHKGNQEKLMELQKEMMQDLPEQMKHSFKPMLITLIPILLIFSWANAHIAYIPIAPQQDFLTVVDMAKGSTGSVEVSVPEQITLMDNKTKPIENNQVNWTMRGNEGTYFLEYLYNGENAAKRVIITKGIEYVKPNEKPASAEKINLITIKNEKFIYMNLLGWKIGWLGTYIIFSLIFSMILRKMFKLQ